MNCQEKKLREPIAERDEESVPHRFRCGSMRHRTSTPIAPLIRRPSRHRFLAGSCPVPPRFHAVIG